MEDMAEAISYAGAVLIMGLALTITIYMFSQVKATADNMFFSIDKTNYQTMQKPSDKGKLVGFETLIPTIYRYYKENYVVIINDSNGNLIERFDLDLETEIASGKTEIDEKGNVKITRIAFLAGAPWVGNQKDTKKRIDLFLYGLNANNEENKINGYVYKGNANDGELNNDEISANSYNTGYIQNNLKFIETISIDENRSSIEKEISDGGEEIITKQGEQKLIITYTEEKK